MNPNGNRIMNHNYRQHHHSSVASSYPPCDLSSLMYDAEDMGYDIPLHSPSHISRSKTSDAIRLGPESDAWKDWAAGHTRRHQRDSMEMRGGGSSDDSESGHNAYGVGWRSRVNRYHGLAIRIDAAEEEEDWQDTTPNALTSYIRTMSLGSSTAASRRRQQLQAQSQSRSQPSSPIERTPSSTLASRREKSMVDIATVFPTRSSSGDVPSPISWDEDSILNSSPTTSRSRPRFRSLFTRRHSEDDEEYEYDDEEGDDNLDSAQEVQEPSKTSREKLHYQFQAFELRWKFKVYHFKQGVKAKYMKAPERAQSRF